MAANRRWSPHDNVPREARNVNQEPNEPVKPLLLAEFLIFISRGYTVARAVAGLLAGNSVVLHRQTQTRAITVPTRTLSGGALATVVDRSD